MKCKFCNGTGKYKQPKNLARFDEIVDCEMNKGYFVNYMMAAEKAYQIVGYNIIDCPYCVKAEQKAVAPAPTE